jgi:hypothetical protein
MTLGVLRASLAGGVRRELAREVVLVTIAMLVYFGIRNATAGSGKPAVANAEWLYSLEQKLGLAWEKAFQSAVIGSDLLVDLSNWVYIWGHWPVILPSAVLLFLLRRPHYYRLRNAMFISGAIGFLLFGLFPVAPPRLCDLGLVDTVTANSEAYRALQPPGLTNQYAAFPSLHAGWNVLLGIILFQAWHHPVIRAFAILSPIAMALAVVTTANHFVIDVAVGVLVVMVGLWLSRWRFRRRPAATLVGNGVTCGAGPARH